MKREIVSAGLKERHGEKETSTIRYMIPLHGSRKNTLERIRAVLRNTKLTFARNMPMFHLSSSPPVGFFPIKALFKTEN